MSIAPETFLAKHTDIWAKKVARHADKTCGPSPVPEYMKTDDAETNKPLSRFCKCEILMRPPGVAFVP
jgi:hypothetical protein